MPGPTLRDVAEACGVSPATVSKALNPHADRCDLSPATKERVVAVARAYGFRPRAEHGRRARRLCGNVGLLWGRRAPYASGVYEDVQEVIAERLSGYGRRLFYVPVPSPGSWRDMQMSQRLDGVLAVSQVSATDLVDLAIERYPSTLLNLRTSLSLPQYLPDEAAGMAALARHLSGLGHRSIIYLSHHGNGSGHFSERERPDAFISACSGLGVSVTVGSSHDLHAVASRCVLGATAVVCYDWKHVPPLLSVLRSSALQVPGSVSVACCADVHWFEHLSPGITALRQPMSELAVLAVDRLMDEIDGRGSSQGMVSMLPPVLMCRGSTGPAK